VLAKVGKAKVGELDLNDLVLLAADYKAIENGDANADELFDLKPRASAAAADLKAKPRAHVGVGVDLGSDVARAPQQAPKPEPTKPTKVEGSWSDVTVKPGKQPFSYYTADQKGEYLTHVDGDRRSCNCGHKPDGGCAHVQAVEAFIKG
jgi:hypothetical protein